MVDEDPPTQPITGPLDDRGEPDTLFPEGSPDPTAFLDTSDARGSIVTDDPTRHSGAYELGELLGRGGMGEVVVALDRRIGRKVALKRLRGASPSSDEISRFVREAQIQARLDHPAIVPVYELAKDPTGRPYFTMKRLSGQTLVQILASQKMTRQRLLRAFADVCRAVDFAHAHGIVHRDLKPANIVLGEFGEVYVLDWGVARVLGDVGDVATADIDTLEGSAPPGQVFGTPGYMAPEQMQHPDVTRAADVYSLGTILFELLAGEPLHPRANDGGAAATKSTLDELTVISPAYRRPERAVPPELDELCIAMLAMRGKDRPTARRCADRIEEYLDGDRDLVSRRALATDLVWRARTALDEDRRTDAMRDASRAMALDPQVEGAAELVTTLMLEPPREPPLELREVLRRADHEDVARHARSAIPGYVMIAAFLPLLAWTGIRSWPIALAMVALTLGLAAGAWRLVQQPERALGVWLAYAVGNAAIVVVLGRLGSGFTFVPALAAFITASLVTYPAFVDKGRAWLLIGIMLAGLLGPIALEAGGMIEATWTLREHGLLLSAPGLELGTNASMLTIVLASLATVVMCGIQASVLGRANRVAQHKLVTQAWHLKQLLPVPVA